MPFTATATHLNHGASIGILPDAGLRKYSPNAVQSETRSEKIDPDCLSLFQDMSPQFIQDMVQETSARLDQSNAETGVGSLLWRMCREWEISNRMDQSSGLL